MKVLILIDLQNDFINGSLGSNEANEIIPFVVEKIKAAKEEGKAIIYTQDTHFENYMETLEGKNLPIKHCIVNTDGWEINKDIKEEISVYDKKFSIKKETFGYRDWEKVFNLCHMNIEEIEICGLCTDICVISNALILRAIYPNLTITVDSNCCAGVTIQSHKEALNTMKMCQINVI